MRAAALAGEMARRPAREVAAELAAVLDAARTSGAPQVREAVETLAHALSEPDLVPYPVRERIYQAAADGGHRAVALMLFEGAPVEPEEDAAEERPLRPRGRPLSLGERKSLARGHRRDILEALIRDPHPDVVGLLLDNPRLTERDVLAIATRRPAPAAALVRVARAQRWVARYAVKRALVFNPYTPAQFAVRLAASLDHRDLRAVADDENLSPPVRTQARLLLGEET